MKTTLTCEDWRSLPRNTLLGFASIKIEELHLTIKDIAVHEKGSHRWAQLPARPQIKDGKAVTDDSGKPIYYPILNFNLREVANAFNNAVVAAILKHEPHAFDADQAERTAAQRTISTQTPSHSSEKAKMLDRLPRDQPLREALDLAAQGLFILPYRRVWRNGKWQKLPYIKWRNRASTDPKVIWEWWAEFPGCRWGIELEQSGLVIVDADRHGGGPDGVAALAELGPLPPHPIIPTPSGGFHHPFRQPDSPIASAVPWRPGSGIDLLGPGRFAAVYEAFSLNTVPVLPQLFRKPLPVHTNAPVVQALVGTGGCGVVNPDRAARYAQTALYNASNDLINQRKPGRGHMLYVKSLKLGRLIVRAGSNATRSNAALSFAPTTTAWSETTRWRKSAPRSGQELRPASSIHIPTLQGENAMGDEPKPPKPKLPSDYARPKTFEEMSPWSARLQPAPVKTEAEVRHSVRRAGRRRCQRRGRR